MTKLELIKQQIEEMKKDIVSKEIVSNEKWANNHIEAIINTVLVMNQQFATAEPRFKKYQQEYSHITTLYELDNLIKSRTEQEFCKSVLGLNIQKPNYVRYVMLKAIVAAFIQYQKDKGFNSDKEAMIDWAKTCDISNHEKDIIGRITNVGVATIQNLRICLGINTIKPDRHIHRALKRIGLGHEVATCELIAELTGYTY